MRLDLLDCGNPYQFFIDGPGVTVLPIDQFGDPTSFNTDQRHDQCGRRQSQQSDPVHAHLNAAAASDSRARRLGRDAAGFRRPGHGDALTPRTGFRDSLIRSKRPERRRSPAAFARSAR